MWWMTGALLVCAVAARLMFVRLQRASAQVDRLLAPGSLSIDMTDRLNEIAARWDHGHAELIYGCALCRSEYAEVFEAVHGGGTR